jgi:Zn-finger nucleic acid-binding protein
MAQQNCPVCKTPLSFGRNVQPGLPVSDCGSCHGFWIAAENYWKWIEIAPAKISPHEMAPSTRGPDTGPAKRCPDCAYFLGHYKVGHGLTFYLDHCGHCGGFWFDDGEWETLRSKGFHAQVHKIFSHVWQAAVAREQRSEAYQNILKSKLGEADYNETQRIKAWIAGHRYRAELFGIILPHVPE